jgi:hypothetical protein
MHEARGLPIDDEIGEKCKLSTKVEEEREP